MTWVGMTALSGVYFDYFNPSFLFLSGGSSVLDTTGRVGFLLLPMAILVPAGIRWIVTRGDRHAKLLLIAFFTAPLAAVIVAEPYASRRTLFMLPFAGLIATYGVKAFFESPARWVRACGTLLVVAIPLCFGYFYADYMGSYRARSAYWFEYNVQGALDTAVDYLSRAETAPQILISAGMNPAVDWHWKYCLLKRGRTDLETRTRYFDPQKLTRDQVGPHAVIVGEPAAREAFTSIGNGQVTELAQMHEPNGTVSFYILAQGVTLRPK